MRARFKPVKLAPSIPRSLDPSIPGSLDPSPRCCREGKEIRKIGWTGGNVVGLGTNLVWGTQKGNRNFFEFGFHVRHLPGNVKKVVILLLSAGLAGMAALPMAGAAFRTREYNPLVYWRWSHSRYLWFLVDGQFTKEPIGRLFHGESASTTC